MDDYLCLTLRSRAGEGADEFNKRLITFWSHVIRGWPDEYAQVHAETTRFEPVEDRMTRKYLVAAVVVGVLEVELTAEGIEYEPVDEDDRYSKYEATPPEWFQIPH